MDYTQNTLRASIRALETVVHPTVAGTGDAQALDQLDFVSEALRFLELRLVDLPARERFAARNASNLATGLARLVADALPDEAAALSRGATDAGTQRAGGAGATAAVRQLIRRWPDLGEHHRRAIAREVLRSERERVEADRAWFAPLGFDPHPDTIPDLEAALEER